MNESSAFFERSCEVAGRFLQSAVVVDDQAYLGRDDRPPPVVTPGRGSVSRVRQLRKPESASRSSIEDLDAKSLIDAFASLGVVCAVLQVDLGSKAQGSEEAVDTVATLGLRTGEATRRSDIVVLDWNIRPEKAPGQNAKNLIKGILKRDAGAAPPNQADDHSRRLRLIAIYTGDLELEVIANELARFLRTLDFDVNRDGKYRIKSGSVMISVYGKGKSTIERDHERRVAEDELPKRLQRDFAGMTAGLLSNAALASLSVVRTNTHRILSRFSPRIDPPYVAHRAMLQPPEEAEEHPVPLIAAEIEDVLADDLRIPELVGIAAIGEWLDDIAPKAIQDEPEMDSGSIKEELLSLLGQGLAKSDGGNGSPRWKEMVEKLKDYDRGAVGVLTKILAPDNGDASALDMEFARLTSLRSRYDEPPPILRLGAIVAEDTDDGTRYWLCVQPLCDSIRINCPQPFPFLKLKEKATDGEPIDFVVFDRDKDRRLKCSRKAFEMVLFKMKPGKKSKLVQATKKGASWVFARAGSEPPLRWIADLKTSHAHRAVDLFANELKRVGLTESEWLRRMATEKSVPQPKGVQE